MLATSFAFDSEFVGRMFHFQAGGVCVYVSSSLVWGEVTSMRGRNTLFLCCQLTLPGHPPAKMRTEKACISFWGVKYLYPEVQRDPVVSSNVS